MICDCNIIAWNIQLDGLLKNKCREDNCAWRRIHARLRDAVQNEIQFVLHFFACFNGNWMRNYEKQRYCMTIA